MWPKFSNHVVDSPESSPLKRARRWRRERVGNEERLLIVVDGNGIELLVELSVPLGDPLGVLYELLVPRNGEHKQGRYQSPRPLTRLEVLGLLERHADFLTGDGRHNLWIAGLDGTRQLVYDQHELLFAYGDIAAYEKILMRLGYVEGELELPRPHSHYYNAEYDEAESRMLEEFDWLHFPAEAEEA